MIELTEHAAQGLERILAASDASQDSGVRLLREEDGAVSMVVDRARSGDVVLAGEHRRLLIVDMALGHAFDQSVLDLSRTDGDDPRFVIRPKEAPAG